MFKWVACLCVVMYLTLLIVGEPPEGSDTAAVTADAETTEVAVIEEAPAPVEDTTALAEPTPAVATTEDISSQVVSVSAPAVSVESLAPDNTQAPVADTATAVPAETTTTQEIATASVEDSRGIGEIWRVTGSTVNLRAGASTQAAVLGRTKRGESAEVMELLDNGWAKVYILETGIEAFMSAKFIERDAQ